MSKKARQRRLADIITRHQVFLERFKAGQGKALAAVFSDLDKRTREILGALDTPNIGELSRKKLLGLLSELKEANGEVLTRGTDELYGNLEKLAAVEATFEAGALRHLLGTKVPVVAAKAETAYKAALAQPLSATGQMLESFIDDWSAGEVQRVGLMVQRAWGEGWTVNQMVQAVRGTKALNFKDGILETSRRNAQTVVRTSIQHVSATGRMATLAANGDVVQGYRFVATLDSKTSAVCRSIDQEDKVYQLGEGPVPPMHPNCRSTIIPEVDPSLDFLDEGATRSAEFGPVDANMGYYDWLKTQDEDFVKEAIGPTRAKLFKEGGLSSDEFARLNLGKNFQPLTLDEMQKLEPLAFKRAGLIKPELN